MALAAWPLWPMVATVLCGASLVGGAVESVLPSLGLPFEGAVLSLTGTGLEAVSHCRFGGTVDVPATVVNSTLATCEAPRGATSQESISFTVLEGGTVATVGADVPTSFDYHPSMFVSDYANDRVLRFNANTGEFVDEFVQRGSGGLKKPYGIGYGPDKNFFVASAGTSSVLKYNGATGAFLARFCSVRGEPRGLVFHYHDLFVASVFGESILRFHGTTGAPRGIFVTQISRPWGLAFDKWTNDTYVTSEENDHVYRYNQPNQGLWGELGLTNSSDERQQARTFAQFDKVFTNTEVSAPNGLVFTVDSLYVTGPDLGKTIVRYNRTSGEFMHYFYDAFLEEPVDLKEYLDYLYVVNRAQVRKYNRLNGEFIRVHAQESGMVGSYLYFHHDWEIKVGD